MINVLALSLVAATLAAAGIWSPPPDHQNHHLVHEGRRVIVVEYDRQFDDEDSSPSSSSSSHQLIQEAKDKYHEASSLLPNLGQGLSSPPAGDHTKGKVSEKAEHAKEALMESATKTSTAVHKAKEKVEDTKEAMESAAKNAVHKAKEKVEDTKEAMESTLKNIAENAKEKAGDIKEKVKEKAEEARGAMKSTKEEVVEEVKKDMEEIGRRMKRLMYNVGRYAVVVPETVKTVVAVVHLMGFAVGFGSSVWVTFVSSYLLARVLPRQQFGVVQSRVYPVYFQVVGWSVGVVIVAHLVGRGEKMQGYYLLAALGFVLVNMFVLEPKATKIMFERMKLEKEEGRGIDKADVVLEPVVTVSPARTPPGMARMARGTADDAVKSRVVYLNKQLKKLNTYSSLLNVLTLMGLTSHLVYLARGLQLTC